MRSPCARLFANTNEDARKILEKLASLESTEKEKFETPVVRGNERCSKALASLNGWSMAASPGRMRGSVGRTGGAGRTRAGGAGREEAAGGTTTGEAAAAGDAANALKNIASFSGAAGGSVGSEGGVLNAANAAASAAALASCEATDGAPN